MKTAVDLPEGLFREVKTLAAKRGQKLGDLMAELLRSGLDAAPEASHASNSPFGVDSVTGLPVIKCRQPTRTSDGMTPDEVANTLSRQEVSWVQEAGR